MKKNCCLLVILFVPAIALSADNSSYNCIEAADKIQVYENYPHFQEMARAIHKKTADLVSRYPDRASLLNTDFAAWLNQENKICSPTVKLADIDLLKNAILLFERRKDMLDRAIAMPDFKIAYTQYSDFSFDNFGWGEGGIYYPDSIKRYAKSFLYNFSLNEDLRAQYSDSIRGATLKILAEEAIVLVAHPPFCKDIWIYQMNIGKYVVDSMSFDNTGKALSKKEAENICGGEF